MGKIRLFFSLVGAVLLTGCAHLTTYQASVGDPKTGVSMDAKQRLLLINEGPSKARFMCAEPSPDVMTAIGASLGASLFSGADSTKNFSGAFSENAQNIGLRTTSIQLMRDALYRVCEAHLNTGDSEEYMKLQAQMPTLVVGLLAIEQLTGAVKSQQGGLETTASASAGGADADDEAQVLIGAREALQLQVKVERDAKDAWSTANDSLKTSTAKDDALKKEQKTVADLKAVADDAAATLKIREEQVKLAQERYTTAMTRARATAGGKTVFPSEQSRAPGTPNLEALKTVSDSVERIVANVVRRNQLDACLELISTKANATLTETICNGAITVAAKNAERALVQAQNARISNFLKLDEGTQSILKSDPETVKKLFRLGTPEIEKSRQP